MLQAKPIQAESLPVSLEPLGAGVSKTEAPPNSTVEPEAGVPAPSV
jgi:hypothetical protein